MTQDHGLRRFLFRLIPVLMVVSFVAWCSSGNNTKRESNKVRVELTEMMMTEGLISNPSEAEALDKVARRMGQPGMNQLLYAAAGNHSLEVVKWIVANGADPKNVGMLKDKTLIQQAVSGGQLDRLDYFLSLGLDPLEKSRDGRSLLHIAAEGGMNEPMLKTLLAKGLRLDATDPAGATALHYASVRSIGVLVNAGLAVESHDATKRTPLHYAAVAGQGERITELVRMSASVFASDDKGRTPLHLAARVGSENAVDALLAASAPRTLRDADNNTPLDLLEMAMRADKKMGAAQGLVAKL